MQHFACSLELSLHQKTRTVSLGKAGASWALKVWEWEASVQLSSVAGSGG